MKLLDGRLINVSNRLPVEVRSRGGRPRLTATAGGLASALDSIWRHQHGLWIGWAGPVDADTAEPLLQKAARGRPYTFHAVPLSSQEVSKFYSGFANEIIWPRRKASIRAANAQLSSMPIGDSAKEVPPVYGPIISRRWVPMTTPDLGMRMYAAEEQ